MIIFKNIENIRIVKGCIFFKFKQEDGIYDKLIAWVVGRNEDVGNIGMITY